MILTTALQIWALISANWTITLSVIAAAYEVVVRRVPTQKDWSIINKIKTIIDIFITNRKKEGGQH